MLTGKINIYECDVDGPPEEEGKYLFWIDGGGVMLYYVMEEDLDDFQSNFDGVAWRLNDQDVVAYVNEQELDFEFL